INFINKLFVKIAKAKIGRIINISSQSVYPQDENVCKNERYSTQISTSYSFQKVIIENFFNSIKELSPGSQVVSLRLPRVIIPSIKGQSGFFGKIIDKFKIGNLTTIEYPENNTNLVHVNDVIS